MIAQPEDRRTAATTCTESVGGRLHGFWYSFGEHDGMNLREAPDNVSTAAVALPIGGGGALSSIDDRAAHRGGDARDAGTCPVRRLPGPRRDGVAGEEHPVLLEQLAQCQPRRPGQGRVEQPGLAADQGR